MDPFISAVRLSKALLCNLRLQPPCLPFARRFAAMYRISQNTPAAASAVPPDRHRGDNQTKNAHQTYRNAAQTPSQSRTVNYRLSDEQEQQRTPIRCSSPPRDTQSAPETPRSIPFCTLYISANYLAQRPSPEGSLVHVLK